MVNALGLRRSYTYPSEWIKMTGQQVHSITKQQKQQQTFEPDLKSHVIWRFHIN